MATVTAPTWTDPEDTHVPMVRLRSVIVWAGLLSSQSPRLVPRGQPTATATAAGASLAFLSWAAWAWLGPRAKERPPRVARAFRILAGVLAAASLVPWFFVT